VLLYASLGDCGADVLPTVALCLAHASIVDERHAMEVRDLLIACRMRTPRYNKPLKMYPLMKLPQLECEVGLQYNTDRWDGTHSGNLCADWYCVDETDTGTPGDC
jgi:hypothetical protein